MTKNVEKDTVNLKLPELYINRELSLLEFNRRVFAQAKDERNPLLERLRFLCIASTNLDEFFEIRVAGLAQQVKYGSVQTGADNMTPVEVLKRISEVAHEFVVEQYDILNNVLIPELARWVKRYFNRELLPVLSPIGLDPAHPFPRVLNKNLYFIVELEGKDAFGRDSGFAIVQAPRSLPRVIEVPKEMSGRTHDFILLSSMLHANVGELFLAWR